MLRIVFITPHSHLLSRLSFSHSYINDFQIMTAAVLNILQGDL